MAFYGMIGAALQRRVWTGPTEFPIFPNPYIVLVGDPSTGKGLVLRPVKEMLSYWKVNAPDNFSKLDPDSQRQLLEAREEQRLKALREGTVFEDPLVFPSAGDSTTFAQVVDENAKSIRSIRLPEKHVWAPTKIYTHNSLIFLLLELESLFKQNQEDVIKYLTAAFDGEPFEHKTKTQGKSIIRRPCLTFIAGTNPDFINESFSNKLIGGGFASRVIFIFEQNPRFYKFDLPQFCDTQFECKRRIIDRLNTLSKFFGQVTFTEDALTFFRELFEKGEHKTNKNTKLAHYYGRKNLHVQKLAMAIHFANNNDMTIGLDSAKLAMKILAELEIKMHLALSFGDDDNPLAKLNNRILKHVQKEGGMFFEELWAAVGGHPLFNDSLTFMLGSSQLKKQVFTDQKTGNQRTRYYI